MSNLPKALIEFNPWSRQTRTVWGAGDKDHLWLLKPDELELIPDGTTLVCINGTTKVVGQDYIDNDTRGGLLAYGLRESQLPPFNPSFRGEWEKDSESRNS